MVEASRADVATMWRRRQTDTSAADTPGATDTLFATATPVESDTFFVTEASGADTFFVTRAPQAMDDPSRTDTSEAKDKPKAFSRFRTRSKTTGTPDAKGTPQATDAPQAMDDPSRTDTSEANGK
jgi:hypothetical protein